MNDVKDEKNIHLRSVQEKKRFFRKRRFLEDQLMDMDTYFITLIVSVFKIINLLMTRTVQFVIRSIAHPILPSFVKRITRSCLTFIILRLGKNHIILQITI